MLKWWEVPQNCECLFALDTTSTYTSTRVFFANNNNRFLTNYSGVNKAYASVTSGWKYKNLNITLPLKKHIYKSLTFNDVNMIFDSPMLLPNEFTILLKCRVNMTTVFLSNNGQDYGMVFGTDGNSSPIWHIKDFVTDTLEYTRQQFDSAKFDNIQTIILKGNLANKDVTFKTDYGLYRVPKDSPAFNSFLKSQTYTTLGHTHTSTAHSLKVDIIAYGLFNKVISDEEEIQVDSTIDDNFLLPSKNIEFKNNIREHKTLLENIMASLSFINLEMKNSLKNVYPKETRPFTTNFKLFEHEIKSAAKLYKNLKNISDIVLEEGLPAKQVTVFLNERNSGILLKTTKSDEKGEFSFYNLSSDLEYTVTANDSKYQFGSIIKNYNR